MNQVHGQFMYQRVVRAFSYRCWYVGKCGDGSWGSSPLNASAFLVKEARLSAEREGCKGSYSKSARRRGKKIFQESGGWAA